MINELGMLAELYERDERCRRRGSMRKLLTSLCAVWLLSACAPVTEVHKIGNEYVQPSYSRNYWWPNWDRTVFCDDLAQNGYCPKGSSEKHTVTAQESVGQGAAKAASGTAPIAAGLALMPRAKVQNSQSVNGTQSQTNKNVPVFESPGAVVK